MKASTHEKATEIGARVYSASDAERIARHDTQRALKDQAAFIAANLDRIDEAAPAHISPELAVEIGKVLPEVVRSRISRLNQLIDLIESHMPSIIDADIAIAHLKSEIHRQGDMQWQAA